MLLLLRMIKSTLNRKITQYSVFVNLVRSVRNRIYQGWECAGASSRSEYQRRVGTQAAP